MKKTLVFNDLSASILERIRWAIFCPGVMTLLLFIVTGPCLADASPSPVGGGSADTMEVQGDPFAGEAGSFDSLIDDAVGEAPVATEEKNFNLGGYLESRNQLSLVDFEKPISLRQRLRLEGNWRHDDFSAFISTDTDLEAAAYTWDGDHRVKSFEVKECYLTYDTGSLDMFVGRKIHRWGTGDGVNPMDLINPLDVTDPVAAGNADNRVASFLMSTTVSTDSWSLEGVLLPRGAVNEQLHKGNPWTSKTLRGLYSMEKEGSARLDSRDVPDEWFRDMEYGGKFSTFVGKVDISFLFYSGFVNSPLYKYKDIAGSDPSYTPVYPEFTAFGFNFATGIGSASTLRGEIAYKPAYPVYVVEGDGIGRRDLWQGVLGWDYDLDGEYYFNVQAFMDLIAGNIFGESGTVNSPRSRYGMTYELSGKYFNNDLETGIRGSVYASDDGSLTDVFCEYLFGDNWKLTTGVMIWTGSETGLMGQYDSNDMLYLNLRYSF